MSVIADILGWLFLASGAAFVLIGSIGLVRLPDFYTRLHAAGITDTLGAGLMLIGMTFSTGWTLNTVKLLLIAGFVLITSPTATHALAKSALRGNLRPLMEADLKPSAKGGESSTS